LHVNSIFPGLEIRYTMNGSIPDKNSKVYTTQVPISSDNITLRTFDRNKRGGRFIKLN